MKETNKKKGSAAAERDPEKLIYVVVAVMLIVMAIVVGVTAAARRSHGQRDPQTSTMNPPTSGTTDFHEQAVTDGEPKTPVTTEPPVTTPAETSPVVAAPSQLEIPVQGTLIVGYSPDVLVRSITMNDYRTHMGIDIAAALGDPVVACADGIVKEVWADPMMGRCVSVSHEGGLVAVFKNLDDTLADGITPGKELHAGDVIGSIGETALIEIAEVPHLHFELTLDGKPQNPLSYFDKDVFAPAESDYEN